MTLIAKQLTFARENQVLITDLNLAVNAGELLQIEGANGSGKSTLLRILAGLIEPQEGEVLWKNQSIFKDREDYYQELHYLGHQNGLKSNLTVNENIQFIAAVLGVKVKHSDCENILKKLQLFTFADTQVSKLSAGQQRRLSLAKLLFAPKALWILDEPTTALDAEGQVIFKDILTEHLKSGAAVIATHQDLQVGGTRLMLADKGISLNITPKNSEQD